MKNIYFQFRGDPGRVMSISIKIGPPLINWTSIFFGLKSPARLLDDQAERIT